MWRGKRRFRRYFRPVVIYRGRRYRRARYRRAGVLSLRPMHRHMLAGAILVVSAMMLIPQFRAWVIGSWVKLRLPVKG
jgi:hypothetical protein